MASPSSRKALQPIFVFDGMRTRSHLFFRYFSTSPEVFAAYHPFVIAAFLGPERWAQHSRNSEVRMKEINEDMVPFLGTETYSSSQAQFALDVAEAESKDKTCFANEHIFNVLKQPLVHGMNRDPGFDTSAFDSNPTYIPDMIFSVLRPIIVLRHPVSHINSSYRTIVEEMRMQIRTGDEDLDVLMSQKYYRYLFDLFRAQGRKVVVVDTDDLLWKTKEVSSKVCLALGLDPDGLSETWEQTPEEKLPKHPILRAFTKAIHASTGIERPEKREDLDLEKAYKRWVERYGDESAAKLKELAEANMPHYEYLCRFKV